MTSLSTGGSSPFIFYRRDYLHSKWLISEVRPRERGSWYRGLQIVAVKMLMLRSSSVAQVLKSFRKTLDCVSRYLNRYHPSY